LDSGVESFRSLGHVRILLVFAAFLGAQFGFEYRSVGFRAKVFPERFVRENPSLLVDDGAEPS